VLNFLKVLKLLESLIDNDKILAGPRVLHSNLLGDCAELVIAVPQVTYDQPCK
jgi:hypothetical protein